MVLESVPALSPSARAWTRESSAFERRGRRGREQAAAQGDDYAQHNLGVMYSFGRGVAQDDAEAVRWYRKAAEQGNADAMRALARGMLEDAMKAKPKGAK